jgi:hypothetical protein
MNTTPTEAVASNAELGQTATRREFESWAVTANYAKRNDDGGVCFHRHGGDGMYEAYCAGVGARELPAIELLREFVVAFDEQSSEFDAVAWVERARLLADVSA